MIRGSKVIRKKVLVKAGGKRRIQRIESPTLDRSNVQVVNAKTQGSPFRRSTEIRAEKRHGKPKGFDWGKVKFSRVEKLWDGETAFLIGGGPSLSDFNFSQLKNKRTIAINKALFAYPQADMLYWTDSRFYSWYKPEIDKFKGTKYTIKPFGDLHKSIKMLKNTGKNGLELDPSAIRHGNNSGHAAMNLAYHLGVKRIVLLGFDMKNVQGKSHFHDGYPVHQTKTEVYSRSMIPHFYAISEGLKKRKVEVINACPGSALKMFKKLPIEKALMFS